MATTVTVQVPSLTAAAPTVTTADATGNNFAPIGSGPHYLRITNGSGGSITCTIDDVNSVGPDGATSFNADVVATVPAGTTRLVKMGALGRFTSGTTGLVALAWSAATSVTFELFA